MIVTVKIKIERDDGGKLTEYMQETIREGFADAVAELSLGPVIKNEGKANEEEVELTCSLESME